MPRYGSKKFDFLKKSLYVQKHCNRIKAKTCDWIHSNYQLEFKIHIIVYWALSLFFLSPVAVRSITYSLIAKDFIELPKGRVYPVLFWTSIHVCTDELQNAGQFLMADFISFLLTMPIAFLPFTALPQTLEREQAVIAELRGIFFTWIPSSHVAKLC